MRFICDTNELNTALSIVSRALAVRSTKPILEGILFESCDEGLRLTCTDLALGIETLLPATFSEEGRAVLPGKLLCEIIRKLPGGPCDIAIGERMQATIRCASVRIIIICCAANAAVLGTTSAGRSFARKFKQSTMTAARSTVLEKLLPS